jgi:hypothetical protein
VICPRKALDEAEKAIAAGYAFDEVCVVQASDGFAWWAWKLSPGNGALFQKMRRPRTWMNHAHLHGPGRLERHARVRFLPEREAELAETRP